MDKMVKVWDIGEKSAHFVTEFSDLNVGSILSLSANPDLSSVIAVGGDNTKSENLKVIDICHSKQGLYSIIVFVFIVSISFNIFSNTSIVSTHFGHRMSETLNKNSTNSDNKERDQ